jgi:hypothetical protein
MCALEGDAIPTGLVFEGNPIRFVLKSPVRHIWNIVADFGFGHHWMTVYAHVSPVLMEYTRLARINGVFPDTEVD